MKPKTAFESGNSPPKVSENGVPIQTGRGLEETKRRIVEAFERVRQHSEPSRQQARQPAPLPPLRRVRKSNRSLHGDPRGAVPPAREGVIFAGAKFGPISKSTRNGVFEVSVPNESPEELYRAAGCE